VYFSKIIDTMPKDTTSMGDWGDFIYRQENSGKKSKGSDQGKKGPGGTGPKKNFSGNGKDKGRSKDTMPPGSGKDPRADALAGRKEKGSDQKFDDFFNSEFAHANYRVDDKDQQFRNANTGAGSQDPGASRRADDIRDKTKKDLHDIAEEREPWNIRAEDIAPEHLAKLYNTGVAHKILGLFFANRMYRSRVKKAQKEIDAKRAMREKEYKLQAKRSVNIGKAEDKKQRMEERVRDSELQLTMERERTVRPVELEYNRLRERVSRLHQAQYSFYRNPINKLVSRLQIFWTEYQSLPSIERKLKEKKGKIEPLEIAHKNLMEDLHGFVAKVRNLKQEVNDSKQRIATIEEQLYFIAGIHPSARQSRVEEAERDDGEFGQKKRGNEFETRLRVFEELRELHERLMTEAECDSFIRKMNEKYGVGFEEFRSKFLKKQAYLKHTSDGKYFWIHLYENNGRYQIKKVVSNAQGKNAA